MTRIDRMMAKAMGHASPDEKWTRLQVDVPAEVADELMRLHRAEMGPNASSATRQGLLRGALLAWWEARDPEPSPPIEGTAVEVIEQRGLLERAARRSRDAAGLASPEGLGEEDQSGS